jgi:phosphoribosylaminoimidazolecarboxamide formyltransferase / IMP cyclohydrolase
MKRALLSVSDKTNLVELARALTTAEVELISTGGTAKALREAGLKVQDISDYTGFPEMMDGRVKTLHPKVHGGLLYLRDNAEHQAQAKKQQIEPIDFVVVNLYPFEQAIRKPDVTLEHAIENIDIGGPSMLRSAAKNYRSVTVVVDPADYGAVIKQLKSKGETSLELRGKLAAKVFQITGAYDSLIAQYLGGQTGESREVFPELFSLPLRKAQSLRYGENPHQQAALYGAFGDAFEQLQGKELSYNNLIDISAAVQLLAEFTEQTTVAILKHTNPCGVGSARTLKEAWELALATDRQAPFGGIIVMNRPLDLPAAEAIVEIFSEVIIAPDFSAEAKVLLSKKKNLRLIRQKNNATKKSPGFEIKSIVGSSWLVQTQDTEPTRPEEWKVVTKRTPTEQEKKALLFGWRVVRHVKSNAIVYASEDRTLGIGAGQMSRVDSSKIAIWKAGEAKLELKGSVVASDAFFPFPDGLIAAAEAGATAVVQPGGSLRDKEVIAAANELNVAMLFTGRRHFRH